MLTSNLRYYLRLVMCLCVSKSKQLLLPSGQSACQHHISLPIVSSAVTVGALLDEWPIMGGYGGITN